MQGGPLEIDQASKLTVKPKYSTEFLEQVGQGHWNAKLFIEQTIRGLSEIPYPIYLVGTNCLRLYFEQRLTGDNDIVISTNEDITTTLSDAIDLLLSKYPQIVRGRNYFKGIALHVQHSDTKLFDIWHMDIHQYLDSLPFSIYGIAYDIKKDEFLLTPDFMRGESHGVIFPTVLPAPAAAFIGRPFERLQNKLPRLKEISGYEVRMTNKDYEEYCGQRS